MRTLLLVLCVALTAGAQTAAAQTRPMVMGRNGVVVSGHPLASGAGLDMLKAGGNAVDAGVATVFAQAVLEFDRFGFGGEVPILIYQDGEVVAVNGHGPTAQASTLEWFQQRGIEEITGDCFLPAVVPAVLDALVASLAERGTMTLAQVLAPSVELAENGFPVYPSFQRHLEHISGRFEREWPSSAAVFLPGGRVPQVGDLIVQKDLARTFRRLIEAEAAADGDRKAGLQAARNLFYGGEMGREIVEFQKQFECTDQNGFTSTGLLELSDFARYRARLEQPAKTTYSGVEVFKPGFWSQGPVLLQTLNLLEDFDLRHMGHNSAEYLHLLSEAMKLAYADREWYYADPDYVGVPETGLLSKAYAAERRKRIDRERATIGLHPGDPYPFEPDVRAEAQIPDQIEWKPWPGGTTGTRVIDKDGNIFSATPSGGWFHTSPIIPGLGFVLGTRGQSFWLDETSSNRIEPGKQPRTTLTPTLALKDGRPFMAWGTPGGDAQDQVNLQVLLNVVEFGMDLQSAVEAPLIQIHDFPASFSPKRGRPGMTSFETRIPSETILELEAMGHTMNPAGPWAIGDGTAAMRDDQGVNYGAAGPRRDKSYAVGW